MFSRGWPETIVGNRVVTSPARLWTKATTAARVTGSQNAARMTSVSARRPRRRRSAAGSSVSPSVARATDADVVATGSGRITRSSARAWPHTAQ